MIKTTFTRHLLVALLTLVSFAQAQTNVEYNVITAAPANSAVVVIVDNVTYPLTVDYGILYHGEAPSAKVGYNYAIIDITNSNAISSSEPFLRPPLGEGQSTPNEFFNRSIDKHDLVTLPQVLEPLSSIHKMKSDLHIPNQIPSIHIYGNTSAIDYLHKNQLEDLDVELTVTYISLQEVYTFDKVKVSLAGRSSRWIPKLSYGLKFSKKKDATLFGYKNFKLRALSFDPSYIRENVAYNVLKASGVPASGFSYVRVFIGNQAVGLYGLIETFQDPWLAATFANGQDDYESGYLYQGNSAGIDGHDILSSDLRYEGTNISRYGYGQYKIKAGPSKKDIRSYKDLQKFTKFIDESTTETTTEEEWEEKLDVEGFLRSMAIEDLLGFSDGYMTMANNFYLYRDPEQENRYTYFAADFDTTIGISQYNLSLMIAGDFTEHPGFNFRPLTKKIFGYEKYLNMYKDIYLSLSKNLVNPAIIDPYIDSIVNMIRADVDWDLALPKVGNQTFPQIPGSDISINDALKFFLENNPPGLMLFEITEPNNISFEVSVNGPSPVNTSYSVKEFIAKKYSQITNFYNQA